MLLPTTFLLPHLLWLTIQAKMHKISSSKTTITRKAHQTNPAQTKTHQCLQNISISENPDNCVSIFSTPVQHLARCIFISRFVSTYLFVWYIVFKSKKKRCSGGNLWKFLITIPLLNPEIETLWIRWTSFVLFCLVCVPLSSSVPQLPLP